MLHGEQPTSLVSSYSPDKHQRFIGAGLKMQPVPLSHFSWVGRLNTWGVMLQVLNEMVMLATGKHNHIKRLTPDRPPRHSFSN